MVRKIFILCILCIPLLLNAQGHITIDKDGYTNMREKPTTKSRIIDRISKYEVFLLAHEICINDTMDISNTPSDWVAVSKGFGGDIGYVMKKNIQPLEGLPSVRSKEYIEPGRLISANDTLNVTLTLALVDENEYVIKYSGENDNYKYVRSIDGQSYSCMYWGPYVDESSPIPFQIKGLEICQKGVAINIPINKEVKTFFNPHSMLVSIGQEGQLFIHISCGDGGESGSICITVADGKIKNVIDTALC